MFGLITVGVYQIWLHNDLIGKLGWIEYLFNTPSHHRVHHGNNEKYIDKNYAGILIIWDRLFGTFQEEEEKPTYGLTTQINSVNPWVVHFHEVGKLFRDMKASRSARQMLQLMIRPPG